MCAAKPRRSGAPAWEEDALAIPAVRAAAAARLSLLLSLTVISIVYHVP